MINIVNTAIIMCSMSLSDYTTHEILQVECNEPLLEDCFGYGEPGDDNYISNEKGFEIFINDIRFQYENACGPESVIR